MNCVGMYGQYAHVPFSNLMRPVHGVTLEAWINTNWQSIGQVAMVGNTEAGGYEFDVNQVGATMNIMFEVHRNGSYGDPSIACNTLSAGWHHFAGTYDERYAKLYVDGTLVATNDAGGTYSIHYSSFNNDLIIGAEAYAASTPAGSYFTGQLDEIRIWDHVRTPAEIQSSMHLSLTGNETGLLAYYTMDDTVGSTTLTDHSGHGHSAVISGATLVASTVVLPVELSSFTASTLEHGVGLRWSTATEVNNQGFEIQRKLKVKSQKEETWEDIAFIAGNGTTNTAHTYSYVDRSAAGSVVYRLKQIDHDGHVRYSEESAIVVAVPQDLVLHQNFPNPFNPSTTISFTVPETRTVRLTVTDMMGREIAVLMNGTVAAGSHSVVFDGIRFASGMYVTRLQSGGQTITRRMMLLK